MLYGGHSEYADNEVNNKCDVKQCSALHQIAIIMTIYQTLNQMDEPSDDKFAQLFNDGYSTGDMINDFQHLSIVHQREYEMINVCLEGIANDAKPCRLSNCGMMKRNQREREKHDKDGLKKLYHKTEDEDIIRLQLLDLIHCFYFHAFDIGYKLKRLKLQNYVMLRWRKRKEKMK